MIAKRTQNQSLFAANRHAKKLYDINTGLTTIAKIVAFKRLADEILTERDRGDRSIAMLSRHRAHFAHPSKV